MWLEATDLDMGLFRDINRENERGWCFLHVFDSTIKRRCRRSWCRAGKLHNILNYNGKYEKGRHRSPEIAGKRSHHFW